MVQSSRWYDLYFGNPKIVPDVPEILGQDDGMTHGIPTILVDPRVQARKVYVLDLFMISSFIIQLTRIGAPSKELSLGSKRSVRSNCVI